MKLYETEDKYEVLIDRYNAAEEDAERDEILKDLKAMEGQRDDKLNACCIWDRELSVVVDVLEREIDLLSEKLKRAKRKQEAFRKYVGDCIGVGEKWGNGVFSLSWRKSEAVKIVDKSLIPTAYMDEQIEYVPMKDAIKSDLKAGATIPGVELEIRQNLQIK